MGAVISYAVSLAGFPPSQSVAFSSDWSLSELGRSQAGLNGVECGTMCSDPPSIGFGLRALQRAAKAAGLQRWLNL